MPMQIQKNKNKNPTAKFFEMESKRSVSNAPYHVSLLTEPIEQHPPNKLP
jgi:hypothetical protein